jgi:hypothetical protein
MSKQGFDGQDGTSLLCPAAGTEKQATLGAAMVPAALPVPTIFWRTAFIRVSLHNAAAGQPEGILASGGFACEIKAGRNQGASLGDCGDCWELLGQRAFASLFLQPKAVKSSAVCVLPQNPAAGASRTWLSKAGCPPANWQTVDVP